MEKKRLQWVKQLANEIITLHENAVLGNDPKKIFNLIRENAEQILIVLAEETLIDAGLAIDKTTLK